MGFAVYGFWQDEPPRGRVWLNRLLIDARYQGRGMASVFLPLLISRFRRAYACGILYLRVYPDNHAANGRTIRPGSSRAGNGTFMTSTS